VDLKFLSSAFRNFKSVNHTRFNKLLVWLESEIRSEPRSKVIRISDSPH
jgi:hypothetical protein